MSLPLKPAAGRVRIGRCAAGAVLVLLAALFAAPAAVADDQPDSYTVTVKVDATSDNAVDARRIARINGQRDALAKLVAQLAGTPDVTLPKLDDNAVTDMVISFAVANEHMSAVRYLADYTFHFHPKAVRRLMRQAGIATAGSNPADNGSENGNSAAGNASEGGGAAATAAQNAGGTSAVLLPVFEDGPSVVLWDDPNPWRDAWAQRPAGSGAARLTVPLGGIDDLTAVDAPQALAGQPDALAAIAAHYDAGAAIVGVATAERQDGNLMGLSVTAQRYQQGQRTGSQSETFTRNPGESEGEFMARAVAGTAAAIASGANEVAAASGPPTSLTATVPITGLGEWVEVRQRLAAVPSVRRVDLLSLTRQEARIEITYSGTPEELRSSLADANLDLSGSDPTWQVRPANAVNPP